MEETTTKRNPYNIIMTTIVIVLTVFVILLGLAAVTSIGKDYSSLFGSAAVGVRTDSMKSSIKKGDTFEFEEDTVTCHQAGFSKNDLIFLKIVDGTEKARNLQVGDIITFKTLDDGGNTVLLTHRIVKVHNVVGAISYTTKGDANTAEDMRISSDDVIGYYTGHKIPLVGGLLLFLKTSVGFLVTVVIPCFLILAYVIVKLVLAIKQERKYAIEEAVHSTSEDEREAIRQEILREMSQKANDNKQVDDSSAKPKDKPSDADK